MGHPHQRPRSAGGGGGGGVAENVGKGEVKSVSETPTREPGADATAIVRPCKPHKLAPLQDASSRARRSRPRTNLAGCRSPLIWPE
jgi:hypothetical protein